MKTRFLFIPVLCAASALLLIVSPAAQAGYIVTLLQVGPDVVATRPTLAGAREKSRADKRDRQTSEASGQCEPAHYSASKLGKRDVNHGVAVAVGDGVGDAFDCSEWITVSKRKTDSLAAA